MPQITDQYIMIVQRPDPVKSFFIEARKTFRKHSEDSYYNRVAQFNNSLYKPKRFAYYSLQKIHVRFEKKSKIFWSGKQ